MKKNLLRNQKGFTLIEIIAVLVILGILAAVAIPRYFGMQDIAREKSSLGALSAATSNVTLNYSQYLLRTGASPTGLTGNAWTPASSPATDPIPTDLGDFTAAYACTFAATSITVTVTIAAKPILGWTVPNGFTTKTFTI